MELQIIIEILVHPILLACGASDPIKSLLYYCLTKLNNYEDVAKPNEITTKMLPNQIK